MMKYFAIGLMAVLGMTTVSMAEVTVDVIQNEDPCPGLQSWTVHMAGTNAYRDLSIVEEDGSTLGVVHQANESKYGAILPSVLLDDLPPDPYLPEVKAVDTHLLFFADDILIASGEGVETNDKSNPCGLTGGDTFDYGLGTFTSDLAFSLKGELLEADIMQVVLPAGTMVYLTGTVRDFAGAADVPLVQLAPEGAPGIPIGIPEPGTVMMLLAGALCLLGIRRK